MNRKTVGQVLEIVGRKTPGSSIQSGVGLSLLYEAANNMLSQIAPATLRKFTQLTNPFTMYRNAFLLPSDVNSIIEVTTDLYKAKHFTQVALRSRHTENHYRQYVDTYMNGYRVLIADSKMGDLSQAENIIVDDASDTNGVLAENPPATTFLGLEKVIAVNGNSAYKFSLQSTATRLHWSKSNLNVELKEVHPTSSFYYWVYSPKAYLIDKITLKLHTSNSQIMTLSTNTDFVGNAFVPNQWILTRFQVDLNQLDLSNQTIVKFEIIIDFNTSGVETLTEDVLFFFDNLYHSNPSSVYLIYNSNAMFMSRSGLVSDKPSSETDYVLLDNDALNILVYETAVIRSQEIQAEDATFNYEYFKNELNRLYSVYRAKHPDEVVKKSSYYYKPKFKV